MSQNSANFYSRPEWSLFAYLFAPEAIIYFYNP